MTTIKQLLGTSWRLETYQSEDVNGDIIYPLGKDAYGTIIFTNEQEMAVQIMANNREKNMSDELLNLYNTETEKQMAQFGYHAYSGPFDINEEKSQLTTHVKMSLLKAYVDSEQTRAAEIDGDTLHLSNVKHPERKLVWKRIK